MAYSALEYLRMLQSLLPWGKAWPRDDSAVLTEFLYAEADELQRIDARSDDLLVERSTITTDELISEHELDLGLPDECSADTDLTLAERRIAARTKLLAVGQQNKEYFIEIMANYGFTAEITEYTPFWVGLGTVGEPVGDQYVLFFWTLSVTIAVDTDLNLLNTALCFVKKYKPGHTHLITELVGLGFDTGFSNGFEALPSYTTDHLTGGFTRGFSPGFDADYGGGFDAGFSIGFDYIVDGAFDPQAFDLGFFKSI